MVRTGVVLFLVVFAAVARATESPEEMGLRIAREAERRDSGWGDMQAEMVMTLRTSDGRAVERHLRTRSMEWQGDGDRTLVIFDEPKDVKGTAFLTYTHKVGQDDQWLYMPSLKRVKRIASSNRSGPFMGSEFAVEDINSEEVERYNYKYLREEACGEELRCYVVERVPVDKNSGYSKQIAWVDRQHYRFVRVDFYDRKGELVKYLTRSQYQLFDGKYWRSLKWEMVNVQNGKSTEVAWRHLAFNTGLTEQDFSHMTLAKSR